MLTEAEETTPFQNIMSIPKQLLNFSACKLHSKLYQHVLQKMILILNGAMTLIHKKLQITNLKLYIPGSSKCVNFMPFHPKNPSKRHIILHIWKIHVIINLFFQNMFFC